MASGYDNTKPTRSSFAFNPRTPAQTAVNAQGGIRPISIVGGQSSGEVVASTPQTAPGVGGGAALGGFFDTLMAPYVERKQKELFVKGVTDQMYAAAGEEIRASNGAINTIFGPSSYEQGAVFYAAKDAVAKTQADMMEDMDNLKRLPPEEFAKVYAGKTEAMLTGDKFTDLAIQTSMLEASGPIMQSVAKQRYIWGQDTAKANFGTAMRNGARANQQAQVSLAMSSAESDPEGLGALAANNQLRSYLVKPEGMDDASYKDSLLNGYKLMLEDGNGYAASFLKNSGVLDIFTPDERLEIEDAEYKYKNRAAGKLTANGANADISDRIFALNQKVVAGSISQPDAQAEMASLNAQYQRRTGFSDYEMFDTSKQLEMGKTIWGNVKSQIDKQQEHAWQLQLAGYKAGLEQQSKATEAQETAAAVSGAWASGTAGSYLVAHSGDSAGFEALASQDFAAGNFKNITANYISHGFLPKNIKDSAQAQVQAWTGQEYNKDFQLAAQQFGKAYGSNKAMALELYGDAAAPMLRFGALQAQGMNPTEAFKRAFPETAGTYSPTDLSKVEAQKDLTKFVDKQQATTLWFTNTPINPYGVTPLNASSKATMAKALTNQYALLKTAASEEDSAATLLTQAKQNGSLERYGQFAFNNAPGTTPMWKALSIPEDYAQEIVPRVVDALLKKNGYAKGASGDNYDIRRLPYPNQPDQFILSVQPVADPDGTIYPPLYIPQKAFKVFIDADAKERTSRSKNPQTNFIRTGKLK